MIYTKYEFSKCHHHRKKDEKKKEKAIISFPYRNVIVVFINVKRKGRNKDEKKKEKVIMSFPYLISFHSAGKPFAPNLNWERNCSRIFSIKIKLQSHWNISGI